MKPRRSYGPPMWSAAREEQLRKCGKGQLRSLPFVIVNGVARTKKLWGRLLLLFDKRKRVHHQKNIWTFNTLV